jgi:tetratricopeptide (TPR) repeat protein
MRNVAFIISALSAVAVLQGAARADRASDARGLFQEANAHFAVGEFNDAAEKYQQAYKLRQDPALLYDAAQSYRLAGNQQKALVLYRNYLQFYPNAPNVDEVRSQIAKLQQAIAASEQAKTAPPTTTAEHAQPPPPETRPAEPPPSTSPAPPATSSQAAAVATPPASRADRTTPLYKKWWLWTIVGVVVVGAVVGGTVAATASSGKWSTTGDIGPGVKSAAVLSW